VLEIGKIFLIVASNETHVTVLSLPEFPKQHYKDRFFNLYFILFSGVPFLL